MAESLEVAALRNLARHIGARVTDTTTPGVHSVTSYHYAPGTGGVGLAVDLAELSGPSALTPGLARIARECARLVPNAAELIYAEGPNLRLGKPYQYGPLTLRMHRNHVHLAVNRGFRFEAPAPTPEVRPMYDPALALEPIVADLACPTGGVWLLARSGAVYAFGGAPYQGAANGKAYFAGRVAARLELVLDDGVPKYRIVATSGETYGPGF